MLNLLNKFFNKINQIIGSLLEGGVINSWKKINFQNNKQNKSHGNIQKEDSQYIHTKEVKINLKS